MEDVYKRQFSLRVDFWGPHQPYFPTQEYYDLYKEVSYPPYASFNSVLEGKPEVYFTEKMCIRDRVYECLKGEAKWNNPDMVEALNKSAEWYQNGWLGGDNYTDLNFDESVQLLSMGMAPFFVGPSNVFQWAPKYFRGLTEDDFGFFPFPATNDKVNYPTYTLGVTSCLSINAFSPYKDECAEILDKIMTNDFMVKLTKEWPGYWAIPLKQYDLSLIHI